MTFPTSKKLADSVERFDGDRSRHRVNLLVALPLLGSLVALLAGSIWLFAVQSVHLGETTAAAEAAERDLDGLSQVADTLRDSDFAQRAERRRSADELKAQGFLTDQAAPGLYWRLAKGGDIGLAEYHCPTRIGCGFVEVRTDSFTECPNGVFLEVHQTAQQGLLATYRGTGGPLPRSSGVHLIPVTPDRDVDGGIVWVAKAECK